MKRFTKWCLILAGFCGAAGLIMILCSGMLGASLRDMMRNGEFTVWKTSSGWHVGGQDVPDDFGSGITDTEYAAQSSVDADEVRKLDIDVDAAEVLFMTDSETDQIRVQYDGEYETFVTETRGDTLKIKEGDGAIFSVLGWNDSRTMVITIPEGFVFDEVTMNMDAGSIEGNGLKVSGQLKVEVDAGSIELHEAAMGELEVDADAGSVALYDSVLSGDAKITADAGSAELYLECEETDFNYQMECDMGSITINENEWSGIGEELEVNNKAEHTIHMECSMGSIEIYTN